MKNTIRILALTFTYSLLTVTSIKAQNKLYPRLFDLQEVTLHDGIFKTAMDLNIQTLLQYDTDRLLTPYMRQAGFTEWETEHPNFSNWGSGNFRLDGHVGGHYLSALALAYATTKDEATRMQLKTRMDYIVDKMDECQRVFDENTNGLYRYIQFIKSMPDYVTHGSMVVMKKQKDVSLSCAIGVSISSPISMITLYKVFSTQNMEA